MKIVKENRDLVLYMLYGDGSINKQGGYFVVRHCLAQKEYIEWKMKLLKKNNINTTDCYFVSNGGYGAYEFRTYTHEFIKQMRKYMYTPYKNIANRKQLNKFNALGLCIWYLDDGGLSQVKDKNGKIKSNTLMLNTMLSKEENQIIIDYFLEVWGIQFRQCKNHNKYRLECGTKEARKFIDIIYPYAKDIPSMQYKLNVKPKTNTSQMK